MYRVMKSFLDRLLSLLLILFFIPVMVITTLLIFYKIGRPILFKQIRPGLNEKLFTIYKFRTMSDEKDNEGNLLPDEFRLKGIGQLIRKLSLDELPQLFNVLKGDMSFIGPRPLLVEYLPLYNDMQKKRHNVKPGITGWAQVNGRNAISWDKKFELDVWYVENQSFSLDVKIFWLTVLKVVKGSDINSDSYITMEAFKGSK